jgi:hypothetical protein
LEEQENMSQLNPNAAEFVPVSPTRSIPSPACRALINDPVLAQSPKRPSEIDINLPNPQDFEKEVKSRPSDFDSFSNGHDHEGVSIRVLFSCIISIIFAFTASLNFARLDTRVKSQQLSVPRRPLLTSRVCVFQDQKSSSQELMENLLNGKNIDEIPEFQPGNTPNKAPTSDEFHFGPNAAPFTPVKPLDQSEAGLSTKAVFGDESTSNLDSTLDASRDNVDFTITMKGKEDDPMSMSFYQDKSGGDADPFDLNQVQVLPENLDDFLGKPDDDDKLHDDTISDVSKQDPARNLLSDDIILNNDERIQTTDLDRVVDDEKELASPVSNDDESSGVCELSKSPQPQMDELLEHLTCSLPKETLPDVCLRPESKSPRPETEEFLQVESQKPQSPSPEPKVLSPEPTSPEPQTASPEPEALTPEPLTPALSPEPLAPVLSPEPPAPVLSPEPLAPVLSPEPLAPVLSPEPPAPVLSPEPLEPVLSHEPQAPVLSPEPQELLLSPEPVVTPEVQDVLIPEAQDALIPEAQKLTLSPEPQAPVLSPEPPVSQTLSPEPSEEICQISKSPVLQALSPEPSEEICSLPKTPEPEKIATPEPEPLTETVSDPIVDEICKFETEERKDTSVESPIEDITSSVKDVTSPISSPVLDQIEADPNIQLNFAQEINNAVQATMPVESSSPINEHNLVPDVCPISTPKSVTDTESVVTTDLNSFLDRSQVADLASPLSPGEQPLYLEGGLMNLNHPLAKCVYPLPTEIKTENITPEFAEPAVISPVEAKEETPSVPSLLEQTVKEPEVAVTETTAAVAAAAVGVAATAAVAAIAAEKKTPKVKAPTGAKKPAPKTAASPAKPAASPTKARTTTAAAAKAKPPTSTRTTTTTAKATGAVPKQAAPKPASKPRTLTTTTRTSLEKKPLANGDVKAPVKASLTARKSLESPKPSAPKPATAAKASPTKPTAPRPAMASSRTTTTRTTTTTAAPKPRPNTLVSKTASSGVTKTTSATTTTTAKVSHPKSCFADLLICRLVKRVENCCFTEDVDASQTTSHNCSC